ncbi:putative Ig domain-containing protein [Sphingomonas sp. MMS24-JH45]
MGLPAGLAIDPATGVISGTVSRSASQPGGGSYTVTVTARDGGAIAATQGFRVAVANPAPTATDDAAVIHAGDAATVAVLANDRDPDGDPLVVTGASAGLRRWSVLADDGLHYVPARRVHRARHRHLHDL